MEIVYENKVIGKDDDRVKLRHREWNVALWQIGNKFRIKQVLAAVVVTCSRDLAAGLMLL